MACPRRSALRLTPIVAAVLFLVALSIVPMEGNRTVSLSGSYLILGAAPAYADSADSTQLPPNPPFPPDPPLGDPTEPHP